MKFVLEINLGNDAMQTLRDVMTAFTSSANQFGAANFGTTAELSPDESQIIRDVNGNVVGKWAVSE